jgi:hypothetical protein
VRAISPIESPTHCAEIHTPQLKRAFLNYPGRYARRPSIERRGISRIGEQTITFGGSKKEDAASPTNSSSVHWT